MRSSVILHSSGLMNRPTSTFFPVVHAESDVKNSVFARNVGNMVGEQRIAAALDQALCA